MKKLGFGDAGGSGRNEAVNWRIVGEPAFHRHRKDAAACLDFVFNTSNGMDTSSLLRASAP
jgi:hypothetical protein